MLECQRNGESSFAVSASVYRAYTKEEGRRSRGVAGAAEEGREERLQRRKRGEEEDEEGSRGETSARACTGPVCLLSAPLPLSAVLIPAIFN